VTAPQGSAVTVFSGEVRESKAADAVPIRLVDDPEAPGYRLIDHDTTYPHRQTELVDVVKGMLPEGVEINSYDVLAVRRIYNIDGDPRYSHTPKFGSTQYSDDFAKWIVGKHKENKNFFKEARGKFYEKTHSAG
jgi:EC042_2821-lke REase